MLNLDNFYGYVSDLEGLVVKTEMRNTVDPAMHKKINDEFIHFSYLAFNAAMQSGAPINISAYRKVLEVINDTKSMIGAIQFVNLIRKMIENGSEI